MLKRFEEGVYATDDVERILELALCGGGMPAREVDVLLNEHVRNKPVGPNAVVAFEVLAALFVGAAHAST